MEKITLENLTRIARAASAGEDLIESKVVPPDSTVKEVRARAAKAKALFKKATAAIDAALEFLEKEDKASSVIPPKRLNDLYSSAADIRTATDVAASVAKSYPDYRAR